jgi:hypothetical protein
MEKGIHFVKSVKDISELIKDEILKPLVCSNEITGYKETIELKMAKNKQKEKEKTQDITHENTYQTTVVKKELTQISNLF